MRRALVAVVIAATLALSGCAATDDYSDATAQSLSEAVLVVSEAGASGEWEAAIAALDEVAARLAAAVEAGEISEDRAQTIAAAIDVVRSDLDALLAAEQDDENGNGPDGDGPPGQDKDKPKDNDKDK